MNKFCWQSGIKTWIFYNNPDFSWTNLHKSISEAVFKMTAPMCLFIVKILQAGFNHHKRLPVNNRHISLIGQTWPGCVSYLTKVNNAYLQ
jgi:hypothetical protein